MILAVTTTLAAAALGAAGVLVGGLVTSLTQVWVDGRRARRDEQREDERRTAELRLAVRLVVEELSDAEHMIREAARAGHYWSVDRQLSNAAWAEYRPTLAACIAGPADWRSIAPAFKELDRLNWLVKERRDRRGVGDEVPVEASDETRAAWYEIQRAIWGLEDSINMADDTATWLAEMKRLEQAHWGDSLQP